MQIQPFNHKKFLLVFLAVVWPQVHLTVHIKKVQVAAVLTLIEWMMDGIIRRRPIIWHIDATQGSCFDRLARDWWRQRREKKWSELTSTDARFFIICSNTHTQLNWLPFIAQDLKSHFQWPHILHLLKISKHLISNWSGMTPEYKCILVKGKRDWRTNIIVGYQRHGKNLPNIPCYDLPIWGKMALL